MLQELTILPILLFSVVVHELAHGWVALRLGDPTARDAGRLTLNPLPHIDPVGSVIVPLLSLAMTGRVFIAWAKPVPVNPGNFLRPRRDDVLVAVAGPASNLLLALGSAVMFILVANLGTGAGSEQADGLSQFLLRMFYGGIFLNVLLAIFNLLPVPPLDGSHVLASLLPDTAADKFRRIGFAGVLLLVLALQSAPVASFFFRMVDAATWPFMALVQLFIP